jgi:hypothetical protein
MPVFMLPVELVEHIVDYLRDDQVSLRSSALVHPSWTMPSQILLFDTIVLVTRTSCSTFLSRLLVFPHLRPYIRALSIHDWAWTTLMGTVLSTSSGFSATDLFPCLDYLRVVGVQDELFYEKLASFPRSLSQLSLERCHGEPSRSRLDFRLRILRIVRCTHVVRFLSTMAHARWPMLDTLAAAHIEHIFGIDFDREASLGVWTGAALRLRELYIGIETCSVTRESCFGVRTLRVLIVYARSE